MNERHAYKIPQLNKWGVIDSTVLEIEIPSTIDASFLNIIKSNPHASYLYNNIKYHLEKIDDKNKRVTLFGSSLELWSDKKELSSSSSPVFVFELPSVYSSEDYTCKVQYRAIDFNIWVTHLDNTIESNGNVLTITVNRKTTTPIIYRVTVNAKKVYSVIGEVLILDFVSNTPVISSQKTALQGGQNNNIIITDGSLSNTSTNPVQNKTITNALNNKAEVNTGYQFHENEVLISKNDGDCLVIGSGKTLSDFVSKDEKRTQAIVDLTEDNIAEVKEIIIQNPGALIRFHEYIYVPTYQELGETIPSYYSCFASDEKTIYDLVIYWETMTLETNGYMIPSLTYKQWNKLTQLLDTINIEEI